MLETNSYLANTNIIEDIELPSELQNITYGAISDTGIGDGLFPCYIYKNIRKKNENKCLKEYISYIVSL
jgi:hypothetical protein